MALVETMFYYLGYYGWNFEAIAMNHMYMKIHQEKFICEYKYPFSVSENIKYFGKDHFPLIRHIQCHFLIKRQQWYINVYIF